MALFDLQIRTSSHKFTFVFQYSLHRNIRRYRRKRPARRQPFAAQGDAKAQEIYARYQI